MLIPFLLTLFAPTVVEAVPAFPIEMNMEYCYEDEPCGEAVWTFYEDGTFESSSGSEGDWWARGTDFRILYDHGSEYRGTLDPRVGCIEGLNRRDSGEMGTFEACVS
ncbi:MAG: hypothetical protein ACI8PZ_003765 [Myxococcota bacterium]|jgi:hypothetical protein